MRKILYLLLLLIILSSGCGISDESYSAGESDALKGVKDESRYRWDKGYRHGYDHSLIHVELEKKSQ